MTSAGRDDTVAIALHWSIAFLILVAFGLGLTVDDFPKAWEARVVNFHALIGVAILVLSIIRLFWWVAPLARTAAKLGHAGLYILMIVVPAIGIPTLLFRGRGLDFGFFQIASPFARTREIFHPLTEAHEIASYALIALVHGVSQKVQAVA